MKKIKKLSVLLLMCFLVSMVSMPVSASAAKLNKKSISLNVGKSYTLKASGTKGKITWTSSKKSVATVSSKGVVKAKKKGTATITAKYGKSKLTCKVTVKQPVTSVKLNKNSASIAVGKSVTLKATVTPTAANNKAVIWKSSNTSVAIVSSNGVVTGRKSGTTTITATAKDGSKKKASCKITVKAQGTTSAKIDPSTYFKTVELNAANVSEYFTYEIIDGYDTWGDPSGASVYLKLKSPDWYLFYSEGLVVEGDFSIDCIDSDGNKVKYERSSGTITDSSKSFFWGYKKCDRSSAVLKFGRAKGTLTFIDKKAIKNMKFQYDD